MESNTDPRPYTRAVQLGAFAVVLVGLLVLIGGWVFDVRVLRTIIPGAVSMKAASALLLVCGATSLLLLAREPQTTATRWLGRSLATLPGVLSLLVLAEYLLGWKLGIDEWPFIDRDGRAAGVDFPGRLAPTTGVCFVFLSAALLSLDLGRARRWRPSELLTLPILFVPSMSLIGYAYSIPAFFGPGAAAKMAVHTAMCFVVLALGILLARPRGWLVALARTTDPGGVMLRRLAPLAALIPFVLGWLHLRTVSSWHLFSFEVGTWWLTAATASALGGMIWSCAGSLSRTDRTRRDLERRLHELANRDELTGLANRRRFHQELESFLAYGRRYGRPGALVILDLDGFKAVNDRHGHLAGDRLLVAVGEALTARVRTNDLVGRLGGDEYGVVLREVDAETAERIAADLVARLDALDLDYLGESITISASAGVAHAEDFHGIDVEHMLSRADASMYLAKGEGGNAAIRAAADLAVT
jgi:diguanylate cyclase (GGDEF)-like protein